MDSSELMDSRFERIIRQNQLKTYAVLCVYIAILPFILVAQTLKGCVWLEIFCLYCSLFISRNREYMADSGAAYLMKDSEPMIGVPNTGRKGGVSGSKLAMSNVDLSRSLTQLIVV
ncbi:M48 family metalloprotease [Helicobacter labetoulli]|nr:M48 family metalloprotease [Helicobacter labetoulli]